MLISVSTKEISSSSIILSASSPLPLSKTVMAPPKLSSMRVAISFLIQYSSSTTNALYRSIVLNIPLLIRKSYPSFLKKKGWQSLSSIIFTLFYDQRKVDRHLQTGLTGKSKPVLLPAQKADSFIDIPKANGSVILPVLHALFP